MNLRSEAIQGDIERLTDKIANLDKEYRAARKRLLDLLAESETELDKAKAREAEREDMINRLPVVSAVNLTGKGLSDGQAAAMLTLISRARRSPHGFAWVDRRSGAALVKRGLAVYTGHESWTTFAISNAGLKFVLGEE